jgi:hypothetical protein
MNAEPPMQPTSTIRPTYVDLLIRDYGTYLGIEGMGFDEQGLIFLEVEGTVLRLSYPGEVAGLVIESVLASLEAVPNQELLLLLSTGNHLCRTSGLGMVTLDPDSGDLVWSDRYLLENFTVEMLDEAIKRTGLCIAAWRDILQEALNDTPPEEANPDNDPISSHALKV